MRFKIAFQQYSVTMHLQLFLKEPAKCIVSKVRQKWKDEVELWEICYLRLLAQRSEEQAWN